MLKLNFDEMSREDLIEELKRSHNSIIVMDNVIKGCVREINRLNGMHDNHYKSEQVANDRVKYIFKELEERKVK